MTNFSEFKRDAHRQLLLIYIANDVMQKDKDGRFVASLKQVQLPY